MDHPVISIEPISEELLSAYSASGMGRASAGLYGMHKRVHVRQTLRVCSAAFFPAHAAVQARLPILRPVEGPLLPRARIPIIAPKPRVVIARHLVGTVGPALHHRRVASTVLGEPDACDPHGQTCESQHVMFTLFGCRVGAGWGVRMWKKIMLPQPTTSTTA